MKSTREQALEWWRGLPNYDVSKQTDKNRLIVKHIGLLFGNRKIGSLSGNEIEKIWRKENPIAALPDELINTDFDGIEDEHDIKPE